jgi:hypothetical protein
MSLVMLQQSPRLVVLALLMCTGLAGCNKQGTPFRKVDPNRLSISGAVTLHGKPLSNAMISFEPVEQGLVASGATLKDGKFQIDAIDGLAPGKYRVKIYDLASYGAGIGGADGDAERPPKVTIPAEYNERSNLTFEVKAGQTNHYKADLP